MAKRISHRLLHQRLRLTATPIYTLSISGYLARNNYYGSSRSASRIRKMVFFQRRGLTSVAGKDGDGDQNQNRLYSPGGKEDLPITVLFSKVERAFPASMKEGWYLTMTSTLIACGLQRHMGDLYKYLILRYPRPEDRQHLSRRLREVHFKSIIVSGIPKVMDSIALLASLEREEDQDHSMTRQEWQADEENHQRGLDVQEILFKGLNEGIVASWGSHREIAWISTDISYGLFLADHKILDIVETELVTMPAVMCQNLAKPTSWHLQACRNVGMSNQDIKAIQDVVDMVAGFAGLRLDKVERICLD